MKEIPQRSSAFRVWLALLLSAFLLCGCLTGCGGNGNSGNDNKDPSTHEETGEDGGKTIPDATPDEDSKQPDVQELWDTLKADIEALDTYDAENSPTPRYTGMVISLKNTASSMPLTLSELQTIINEIDSLLGLAPEASDTAKQHNQELKPTQDALESLKTKVNELLSALQAQNGTNGTIEPDTNPIVVDNTEAIQNAQQAIQSDMKTGFDSLTKKVEGLKTTVEQGFENLSKGLSGFSPVIIVIGFVLCFAAVVIGVLFVKSSVDKIAAELTNRGHSGEQSDLTSKQAQAVAHANANKQSDERPVMQFSADNMETLRKYIVETQALKEQVRRLTEQLSAISAAQNANRTGTPAPETAKIVSFKWDKQTGLNETAARGEFSGEPTDKPNEYRIWPDPRGIGTQSRVSQDIGRNPLYFGFVNAFFDINPQSPGNHQTYSIYVEEYAVVKKDSATHYVLVTKGKIQATGVS